VTPAAALDAALLHVVTPARLLARLDSARNIAVLRAPHGFGKTTTVRSWLAQRPDHGDAAWLRVTPDISSGDLFWESLVLSLEDAALARAVAPTPRGVAERMLRGHERDVIVVLDDADRLDEEIVERLSELVVDVEGVLLVVCVRTAERFSHEPWSQLGGVEISADELTLTRAESSAVLDRGGLPLRPTDIDAVQETFAGWPVALSAMVRRGSGLAGHGFSALIESTLDDLRRQVMALFEPDALATWLLPTAVPEVVSRDDLPVLGLPGSVWRRLAELASQGLVMADSLERPSDFRWPAMTRRILLDEFRRQRPHELRKLHRHLATHYGADGRTAARALTHAVAAEDWRQTIRIIERSWAHIVLTGDPDERRRALAAAPPEVFASPVAIAAREMTYAGPGFRDALLKVALPASPDALDRLTRVRNTQHVVDAGLAVAIGFRQQDLLEDSRTQFERLEWIVQAVRDGHEDRLADRVPGIALHHGITHLLSGDVTSAVPHLERAYRRGADSRFAFTRRDAAAKLALAEELRGDVVRARLWLNRAAHAPVGELRFRWDADSMATARVLADAEALEPMAIRLKAVVTDVVGDEMWVFTAHARARAGLAGGDRVGALDMLQEIRNASRELPAGSQLADRLLLCDEIDLEMASGLGSRAAERLASAAASGPEFDVRRARLARFAQDWPTVMTCAGAALAAGVCWPAVEVEALVHLAAAYAHTNDPRAGEVLDLAAARATASGCIRPFAGPREAALIRLVDTVPNARGLLHHPAVVAASSRMHGDVRAVYLTNRERTVLRLLAAGSTLPEIAREEYVSINTVKTQARALYRKLGAVDRDDAVRRAREHGLL
jgi:LuxR family maltose regulon positive regulatory protein